jgi:BON domain-containing protein
MERQMALATETRSDAQIQQDALAELKWDARVQPNEVGVSTKNGVVTLTGYAASCTKKWAADEIAHRVRRVKAVANDIQVKLPGSSGRTDSGALLDGEAGSRTHGMVRASGELGRQPDHDL